MRIKIIDVSAPESLGTGNRRYQAIQATYREEQSGKVSSKKLLSFSYPEVYKEVSQAQKDDILNVSLSKNDKGFWDWVSLGGEEVSAPVGNTDHSAVEKSTKAPSYPAKLTYETPEERAIKQRLIVRQSSFAQAVALNPKGKVGELFPVAEEIVDWVYLNPVHDESEVQ